MATMASTPLLAAGQPVTQLADLATRGLVSRAGAGTTARERTLPLLAAFDGLVPHGSVQRGSVIGCQGVAAVSLALALAAGPSQQGAWVGVAGFPSLGLAAAAEVGVSLDRVVSVAPAAPFTTGSFTTGSFTTGSFTTGSFTTGSFTTGSFTDAQWADLLAAFIDGFDVVVLGPGTQQVRPGTVRRLLARLQSRGAVAITVGAPVFGADLCFETVGSSWVGLGAGYGVAQGRVAEVVLSGRRVPQTRRARMWLPGADGHVRVVADIADITDIADIADTATGATVPAPVVPLRRTG